jgi:hypothetical protein
MVNYDIYYIFFINININSAGQSSKIITADYTKALQVVDSFLYSWVNRNAKDGIQFISKNLRDKIGDDEWIRQYMTGLSNPHHMAFEINSGRIKIGKGFLFDVTLYELVTYSECSKKYSSTIEVIKENNEWRIDILPRSSDNF